MQPLSRLSTEELLAALAAPAGPPAAGSALALTAATAAALVGMGAKLTVTKADTGTAQLQERYAPFRSRAADLARRADELRGALLQLLQDDAAAVEGWLALRRQDAHAAAQQEHSSIAARTSAVLEQAAKVPLAIARASLEVAEYATELFTQGYQSAAGDALVAFHLAATAATGALSVSEANLDSLAPGYTWHPALRAEAAHLAGKLAALRHRSSIPMA